MFDKYGVRNILLTNITFYLYRLVGGKNNKKINIYFNRNHSYLKKIFIILKIKTLYV